MTDILHLTNEEKYSQDTFAYLEGLLPKKFHGIFLRYRRWQDRQAGLLGKLLLRQLLINNGHDPGLLSTYRTDQYGRPSIDFAGDFNISHSEGKVITAITDASRIGIDIERIKDIVPQEFSRVFTNEEAQFIRNGAKDHLRFYEIWTKKEAAMKADGRGFHLDPSMINTLSGNIRIGDNIWETAPLSVSDQHTCYFSQAKQPTSVRLTETTILAFL